MDKVDILPNGQWKLEKMSKLLKPKKSQNFLIPKNPNNWDMGADTSKLGEYNPKNDQSFSSAANHGAIQDATGVDFSQNTDHHEHQHRILRHMGDKLNMKTDGKDIKDPQLRSHVLAQHLMDSSNLTDEEHHAIESSATGGNLRFDSGDLKGQVNPNEAISNIVGWMNMGNDNRSKYLGHMLEVDHKHDSVGQVHDKLDPHVRSAYKKISNTMQNIEPGHTLHWNDDNTVKHDRKTNG